MDSQRFENISKKNSKLEYQKSTSAILFPYKWACFLAGLRKIGVRYDVISRLEHFPPFLPFGGLMFVTARKCMLFFH